MDDGFLPGIGKIDYTLKSGDNDKQDDKHEEIIKISEQEPLNDPACEHEPVLDGEEMGDTVAVSCKNCPYGWFVPKGELAELGLK